jgi:hypothetical protein|tara:strand:+ start:395 stop:601 length:207 start_codon:yes stop_codon:yes gene_type:complete
MLSRVRIVSGPAKDAPKAKNAAEIQGQGTIPYAKLVEEKTPDIGKAKVTVGKKRGMGAAQRGSRFTNA